jgi:hypothetical protein
VKGWCDNSISGPELDDLSPAPLWSAQWHEDAANAFAGPYASRATVDDARAYLAEMYADELAAFAGRAVLGA